MNDTTFTAPNGMTFANLGLALRSARWGELGKGPVRLTREGYTDTEISRGGPAGWYVSRMGDRVRKPA